MEASGFTLHLRQEHNQLFLFNLYFPTLVSQLALHANVHRHSKCDAAPTPRPAIYKPPNRPERQSGRQKGKKDVKERRRTETVAAKGEDTRRDERGRTQ